MLLVQLFVNGIFAGSMIALMGLSFSLIYRITRTFLFSHGVIFTVGAYCVVVFETWLGLPQYLSILLSIAVSIVLGCMTELMIYRPLRQRGSSSLIVLLASLGIYTFWQNVISLIFGDDIRSIRFWSIKQGIDLWSVRVTPFQIVTFCLSTCLLSATLLVLKKMKIGKALRAVANDPELAQVSGVESERLILWSTAAGCALAGITGIMMAFDVDMTPTMGFNALMLGVVTVIIGGLKSIGGIALGALLLGMAQHLGVWKISSGWQDTIAFLILLAFLILRPEGFRGRKLKKARV